MKIGKFNYTQFRIITHLKEWLDDVFVHNPEGVVRGKGILVSRIRQKYADTTGKEVTGQLMRGVLEHMFDELVFKPSRDGLQVYGLKFEPRFEDGKKIELVCTGRRTAQLREQCDKLGLTPTEYIWKLVDADIKYGLICRSFQSLHEQYSTQKQTNLVKETILLLEFMMRHFKVTSDKRDYVYLKDISEMTKIHLNFQWSSQGLTEALTKFEKLETVRKSSGMALVGVKRKEV